MDGIVIIRSQSKKIGKRFRQVDVARNEPSNIQHLCLTTIRTVEETTFITLLSTNSAAR